MTLAHSAFATGMFDVCPSSAMKHILFVASLLAVATSGGAEAQVRPRPQTLPGVAETSPSATASSDAFFDDSVLHEIRLDINSKDWQALKENYLANTYYPADFRWGADVVRNVGIRSRGTASRSGVKPGLRVDFNRYSTDQTFLGLKSFILRNNTTDASSLHDRLGTLFFRRMGVPASREAQTKLYVNGAYAGLYSVVESIDKSFLSRTFNENDGYLYKYDRNVGDAPYYFEYLGQDAASYVPRPFKPETHETDPQPQPLVDMVRMVADLSDEMFRSSIAEYLDLAAFVKHVALESFLAETDGVLGDSGMNNFYLYRLNGQRLHVLIPWDKSEATNNGPTHPITHNIDDVSDAMRNRLMVRVWRFDDLKNLYLDTLLACVTSAAETVPDDQRGWMEREVEREFAQIQEAALSDPEKLFTDDQVLTAADNLRTFAQQRGHFVTSEVHRVRP
jgi:spore coat protein CotH